MFRLSDTFDKNSNILKLINFVFFLINVLFLVHVSVIITDRIIKFAEQKSFGNVVY